MAKKNSLKNNPLVNPPKQGFNAPPFGIAKPEHVEPAIDWAIAKAKDNINAIVNRKAVPTFKNTIAALSFSSDDFIAVYAPYAEMRGIMNTKEVQAVSAAISPKITEFATGISLNKELFKKVKQVYDTVDKAKLSEEENTLLEKTYNSFKNNGALLKGKDREKYKKLQTKHAKLKQEYGNNLTNSAAELKIVIKAQDASRLDGIPQDIINLYRQNAVNDRDEADDSYVITMTPPPMAVYEYAKDRSLREEVKRTSDKIGSHGKFDNTQIVLEALKTRHEIANILGFKNHAEQIIRTDTRMAENSKTAMDFVQNNAKAYFPVAKKFFEELADFAKQKDGLTEIKPWDRLYYIRLMREDQIGYNPEDTRAYFELESTLQGMFDHAEKLFGITVKEVKNKYSTSHEDIRTYEISDTNTGEMKSLFYLDPYARPNKRSGAWMNDIRGAGLHNGTKEIPIAGNYCNFTKPADGNPSLLTDSDVETLWHEFGHACHGMLGNGTYHELSGTNTHWDYVELPSQINECWAFKPEVLNTYAKHYDTGDVIPKSLSEKLQKLNAFDAKWQGIRQTELGLLDLALHTTDPAKITDLMDFQNKVWGPTELVKWDGPPMVTNFGHIISGGYSAGYYSYKWADALVADVFEQFEKQGIYNKALCKAFKETMIEPGGTKAPSIMHKDFMESAGEGRRELDGAALFRREGLISNHAKPKGP
jgi:peptidyl-dipeptidase Dcp